MRMEVNTILYKGKVVRSGGGKKDLGIEHRLGAKGPRSREVEKGMSI